MRLIKKISTIGYMASLAALFTNFYLGLTEEQLIDVTIISFVAVVLCIATYYYGIFFSNQRLTSWLDKGYMDFISVVPGISFWVSLTILFYIMDI